MNFASKINGLEEMNHHEQLKNLAIYSLEKIVFFLIMNAWQQIQVNGL